MSLDRSLEKAQSIRESALYRPLAQNISAALKDYGFLRIYSFPTMDSVIAASITFSFTQNNGGDAEIVISSEPPRELREPSVLLGYPASILEEIKVHAASILISGYGSIEGLTIIPTLYQPETSIAANIVSVLSEIGVVGELAIYSIISSYWRGLDIGRKAEFKGAEKAIIETLKLEGKLIEELTLRLFGWYDKPLKTSIEITVDPFLPGLTGRGEEVSRFLEEDPRLRSLGDISIRGIKEEKLALLGEKLYELLKKKSRAPRRPSEIIGYVYYSPNTPIGDLREASIVYAALSEAKGFSQLVALTVVPIHVSGIAYYDYYNKLFMQLVNDFYRMVSGEVAFKRMSLAGKARIVYTSNLSSSTILLTDRVLRQVGVIGADEILAVESSEGIQASTEKLVAVMGFKKFYEAIREKCIDVDYNSPLSLLKPSKCGI